MSTENRIAETEVRTQRPEVPRDLAREVIDPTVHASDRIHEVFARLRADQPLGLVVTEEFDPFWLVTRQADLRSIAAQPDLFNNGDRLVLVDRASEHRIAELLGGQRFPIRTILQMDPPEHTFYRNITAEYFHARGIDALADQIRAIARGFVDDLIETGGECDFTRTVSFLYPLRVIMSIMGVPREDEPEMLRLTQEFMGAGDDEDFQREDIGASGGDTLAAVTREFNAYFDVLLANRRSHPRDDVVSAIANARLEGAELPDLEARSYCAHLATAGHETTSSVTSGGMLALCNDPALFRRIKADRSLIRPFVEEASRFATPSKITMRTVARDTVHAGRAFQKGDWMAMAWASGNRDEAVIADPDVFRIDRQPNKHITYGVGAHVCLGQHLARLEMRILFEELFERLDSVELAGEPKVLKSLIVSGLKSLPIRFHAR
jgi:cytochrome P450